jgi:catechol 2,3-dioxygenase-like lactoylglutathione lyase family enzyme
MGEDRPSDPPSSEPPSEFPLPGMALSHILVVREVDRARDWYVNVLGARLYREYGGTTAVLDFEGAWLVLVSGGGPTRDKPGVTFAPPAGPSPTADPSPADAPSTVSHSITIRVPDCRAAYETLGARGATFLTPPVESDWEVRCFFRDPDGHLFEISEAR